MSLCKAASVLMLEIEDALMSFEKKETKIPFPVFSQLVLTEVKTLTLGHPDTTVWSSCLGFRHLGRVVIFVLKPEPLVLRIFQGTARLINV